LTAHLECLRLLWAKRLITENQLKPSLEVLIVHSIFTTFAGGWQLATRRPKRNSSPSAT
jgi:hypothetical protein